MKEKIIELLQEQYPDCKINMMPVRKNNNVTLTGITILENGTNISPTIYIDELIKQNLSPSEIVTQIKRRYEEAKHDQPHFEVGSLTDFNKMQSKICYRLVNTGHNQELLETVPYLELQDLSVLFYLNLDNGSAVIHNSLADLWNVDADDLFELASKNTPILNKMDVGTMSDVMFDIFWEEHYSELAFEDKEQAKLKFEEDLNIDSESCPMYIVSNQQRNYGAATLLYDEGAAIGKIAMTISPKGCYVLPSSTHELILIPKSASISLEDLKAMVADVNRTQVNPVDYLSDNVYELDPEIGFRIAIEEAQVR